MFSSYGTSGMGEASSQGSFHRSAIVGRSWASFCSSARRRACRSGERCEGISGLARQRRRSEGEGVRVVVDGGEQVREKVACEGETTDNEAVKGASHSPQIARKAVNMVVLACAA